jgi:hypothetical protein
MMLAFALLAATAGAVQAWMLLRAATRPALRWLVLRAVLVLSVLVAAAAAGHIVAGAVGWLVGFALTTALLARRLR